MTIKSTYEVQAELAKLVLAHPRLFRGASPRVDSYVSPGWREIIADLFAGIERLLSDEQAARVSVEQIKEKFGGLRVYLARDREAEEDDDDEAAARLPPFPEDVWAQVNALVEAAEERAAVTCEVCGAPGKLLTEGWRTVVCDRHIDPKNRWCRMRLLIMSDLHVEHATFAVPEGLSYDVAVLAGDILTPGHRVPYWCRRPSNFHPDNPVVIIGGNHEFYGTCLTHELADMRAAADGTNVHFLERDEVVLQDPTERTGARKVRFLGCMLWTDFALKIGDGDERRSDVPLALLEANRGMNDFRCITLPTDEGPTKPSMRRMLRAEDTAAFHAVDRAWLLAKLQEPFDGPTVVVTHHGPSAQSVHPKYAGDWLTPSFVSDLPAGFFAVPDLWVHGHTHSSFDYIVGKTNVICNPRGYRLRDGSFENADFDPALIVTV